MQRLKKGLGLHQKQKNSKPSTLQQTESLNQVTKQLKSDVNRIVRECREAGTKFVDEDFPPELETLFIDPKAPLNDSNKGFAGIAAFRRLTDAYKNPQLFVDGIGSDDIFQGSIGSCWFVAALSVVATRPEIIKKIFVAHDVKVGVYGLIFYADGEWVPIIVDDFFPIHRDGEFYFSKSQGEETWVMVAEKAYAKLHGCYELIVGGVAALAIEDLTGGPGSLLFQDDIARAAQKKLLAAGAKKAQKEQKGKKSKKDKKKNKNNKNNNKKTDKKFELTIQDVHEDLFERVKKLKDGGILTCAFRAVSDNSKMEGEASNGLVSRHAYGIIDAVERGGIRLLKIRNPWGQNGEWQGDWSDKSPLWNKYPSLKKELHVDANDGTFWMSLEDFLDNIFYMTQNTLFNADWVSQRVDYFEGDSFILDIPKVRDGEARVIIQLRQPDNRFFQTKGKVNDVLCFSVYEVDYESGEVVELVHRAQASVSRGIGDEVSLKSETRYLVVPHSLPFTPAKNTDYDEPGWEEDQDGEEGGEEEEEGEGEEEEEGEGEEEEEGEGEEEEEGEGEGEGEEEGWQYMLSVHSFKTKVDLFLNEEEVAVPDDDPLENITYSG